MVNAAAQTCCSADMGLVRGNKCARASEVRTSVSSCLISAVSQMCMCVCECLVNHLSSYTRNSRLDSLQSYTSSLLDKQNLLSLYMFAHSGN